MIIIGAQPMIEIHLPKLTPTMSEEDVLQVEQWYKQEGDLVHPGDYLVVVATPWGRIMIPTSPAVTTDCYIYKIYKPSKADVRLGDLLISLEPAEAVSKSIL
jgi:pyruvate/2-oxoglutarate dehydrogenase complex dihydrolipoamide acyltransferase (E2) component